MTEQKSLRLRKGQGRRQFIVCLSRIKERIAQGYDIIMIYEELRDEGLITMSYGGFYDLITQRKRKKKPKIQFLGPFPYQAPLLPVAAPVEQLMPSKPVTESWSGQQPANEREKQGGLPQPQPERMDPSNKIERGKAVQTALDNGVKANEQFLNDSNSDSELEKEKDRLI